VPTEISKHVFDFLLAKPKLVNFCIYQHVVVHAYRVALTSFQLNHTALMIGVGGDEEGRLPCRCEVRGNEGKDEDGLRVHFADSQKQGLCVSRKDSMRFAVSI